MPHNSTCSITYVDFEAAWQYDDISFCKVGQVGYSCTGGD